jgi:predicted kinase
MLIIFGGLPGVGKTALAAELARVIGAVHLRVDSIEQAIRASGLVSASQSLDDAGYRVAYAVAEDNLRIGRTVIADSVNPRPLTREAWAEVAKRARVGAVEIEVQCSDVNEHRRRVETRTTDIPGLKLPTWEEVVGREYHPWDREHLAIDTAGRTVERNVDAIREVLPER